LCINSKNFEHESYSSFENLQLWFWTKIYLSYILEIIFKTLQLWFWTKVHLNNGLKFIFKTCLLQWKDILNI